MNRIERVISSELHNCQGNYIKGVTREKNILKETITKGKDQNTNQFNETNLW